MIKSESLAALAKSLVKAQQEMGAALKDSKNPFFKSKYADLNAIIDASIPALNANGIAVLQSPGLTQEGTSVINTVLLHESGEYVVGQSKVVAAKQNDPQAEGSATTYARRYGLQAMVTLKAEDDDGEGAMNRQPKPSVEKKEVKQETKTVEQETKPSPEKNVVPRPTFKKDLPEKEVQETKEVVSEKKTVPVKKGWASKRAKPATEDVGY